MKVSEIKKNLRPSIAPLLKGMDLGCNWSNVRSDEKERRLLLRVWDVTPVKRSMVVAFRDVVNFHLTHIEPGPGCNVLFEVVMDEGPRYINTCDGSSGSFDPRTGVMTHHRWEVAHE